MVLTDGPRMVLTPTYHVFEMFKVHQDALRLPLEIETGSSGPGDQAVPQVSASASKDERGRAHLSLCNLDVEKEAEIQADFSGAGIKAVSGRILTHARKEAHNSFERPDTVGPAAFDGAALSGSRLRLKLPAKSVAVLEAALG
jgi:alpha-N-arabinofuranosidase